MQPPEPCPQGVVRVRAPDNVPTTQGALGDSQIDDVGNAGRSSKGTPAAGLLEGERLNQAETSDGRALAIIRSSHASASACSCEVNAPRSASYSATAARPASMRRARCAAFASQPEYVIPDRSAAARIATPNSEGTETHFLTRSAVAKRYNYFAAKTIGPSQSFGPRLMPVSLLGNEAEG